MKRVLSLIIVLFPVLVLAERINVCDLKIVGFDGEGYGCEFTTQPGDRVYFEARYNTPYTYIRAYIGLFDGRRILRQFDLYDHDPFDSWRYTSPGGERLMISHYLPSYDELPDQHIRAKLVVDRDPNYKVQDLKVHDSGDVEMTFFSTQWSNEVRAELWAGRDDSFEKWLYAVNIPACNQAGGCTNRFIAHPRDRWSVRIGLKQMIAVIDKDNHVKETSEADNKKVVSIDQGIERIPNIMRNLPSSIYGEGWNVPAHMMDHWFSGVYPKECPRTPENVCHITQDGYNVGAQIKNLASHSFFDVPWVLNHANGGMAVDIRVTQTLDKPALLFNKGVRLILKERLNLRFNSSGRRRLRLSRLNVPINELHEQNIINFVGGLPSRDVVVSGISAITGGLGSFMFFGIPKGSAIRGRNLIRVSINGLYLYVADGYDFRGEQQLGCWSEFDLVIPLHLVPGCTYNSDYRRYRRIKKRGMDFVATTPPFYVAFKRPYSFVLRRN